MNYTDQQIKQALDTATDMALGAAIGLLRAKGEDNAAEIVRNYRDVLRKLDKEDTNND